MQPIRVFLVDDHPVVREGLKSLIASFPDLEVVGDAQDAFAIVSKIEATRSDVVLLDIRLGNSSGIEAARLLRRHCPSVKIIILTTYDDAEYLQQALAAEVHGYLLKSASHEQLAQAIRTVYQGEKLLSPPLLGKVMEEFGRLARDKSRHESGLSDQELQVLREIGGHVAQLRLDLGQSQFDFHDWRLPELVLEHADRLAMVHVDRHCCDRPGGLFGAAIVGPNSPPLGR